VFLSRILALLLILATAMAATVWAQRSVPVVQPLFFSHQRHIAEGMNCVDCHRQADKGTHATLPPVKACLLCHAEAKGEHPDEPKIREYAERQEEIPWARVNRLPGHVYFSHVAHVGYAQMECATCHGEMKELQAPVTMSQIRHLDMRACMNCHEEKGASNDCLRCHK
jgi:menaquinone reductase, multiheme cytochrome c subunit